jgi:hypothetical protein
MERLRSKVINQQEAVPHTTAVICSTDGCNCLRDTRSVTPSIHALSQPRESNNFLTSDSVAGCALHKTALGRANGRKLGFANALETAGAFMTPRMVWLAGVVRNPAALVTDGSKCKDPASVPALHTNKQ